MFLKQAFLFSIGVSAGGVIAAGIFAFLAMIGIFPRIIGETGTRSHIILCETMMIIGGVVGNVMDLYHISGNFGGRIVVGIWGIAIGIFVGCLVMSLAETVKALPVLCRRIHFSVGLPIVILAIALGKLTGSMIYFFYGFGGT